MRDGRRNRLKESKRLFQFADSFRKAPANLPRWGNWGPGLSYHIVPFWYRSAGRSPDALVRLVRTFSS